MHTTKRIRGSKTYSILLVAGGLLLSLMILCLSWYIARGVLRDHVIPGYYFHRYGPAIQTALDMETRNANTVFRESGLQFTPDMPVHCNLDIAINIRTSIWCGGETRGRLVSTKGPQIMAADLARADAILKKQGWRGGIDRPWGDDPGAPVSYSYSKKHDQLDCSIQLYHDMRENVQGSVLCHSAYTFMGDPYERL